jgi:hypothetical protein
MSKSNILTKKNKKSPNIKSKKIKKNQKKSKKMKGGVDPAPLNMIEYQTFHKFFEENKSKILIPQEEINTHSVNYHTIENIKEKIKTNYEHEIAEINKNNNQNKSKISSMIENKSIKRDVILFFLEYLKNNIRYINFTEYLQKIESISDNIKTQIINSDAYDTIILVTSMQIEKSNFWILLLYLQFIDADLMNKIKENKKKIYVTSNIEYIYKYYETPELKLSKKVAVIYFDDMIYSGIQSASAFKFKILRNDMVDIFLGVGFISTIGLDVFKRFFKETIKIFANTEIIPVIDIQFDTWVNDQYNNLMKGNESIFNKLFIKLFTDENKADHEKIGDLFKKIMLEKICTDKLVSLEFNSNDVLKNDVLKKIYSMKSLEQKKGFYCRKTHTLTYFDHKLADGLSTMNIFLRFGTYPINEQQECLIESVINNCGVYQLTPNLCDSSKTITDEDSCPKTFYKTIEYTFNGQTLNKIKTIDSYLNTLFKNKS